MEDQVDFRKVIRQHLEMEQGMAGFALRGEPAVSETQAPEDQEDSMVVAEKAADLAEDAVDKAKDMAEDAADAAGDMVDKAKDFAEDVADKAEDVVDDVVDKAKDTFDRDKD